MDLSMNWLWFTLVVPVVMGIFKSEIGALFRDYSVYRHRMFDEDGDPATGEPCHILIKGEWKKIMVAEYQFGLSPAKRRVITYQPDPKGGFNDMIVVPYTYTQWANLIKGSVSKPRTDVVRKF